jgi:hypothetical protein
MPNYEAVDLKPAWIGCHLIGDGKELVFDYLSRRNYLHASTVALANRIVAIIRIFGYELQIVYLQEYLTHIVLPITGKRIAMSISNRLGHFTRTERG